mgnify:CR=1 FL=1
MTAVVTTGVRTALLADPTEIGANMFDVEKIRRDFPVLQRTVHGKPLVYLDSAASSQRPRQVQRAVEL